MGVGWGEGEESRNSGKLFIPLPFIPSRQGRGYSTFYEFINFRHFLLLDLKKGDGLRLE
jgi:hypothetical protein